MPIQQTSGNVTADAYGGGVAAIPNYIEDVFSTYLYNGGSPPKTITNNIDLSGKGGLVWIKSRNLAESHRLVDTVRGATKALYSNATDAQVTEAAGLTAFTSSGFTVNYDSGYCGNTSTDTYASWTFRKQPKFFDVVTWTGTGTTTLQVAHNLQSIPGFVAIKAVSTTGNWSVVARESSTSYLYGDGGAGTSFGFNTTDAPNGGGNFVSLGYLSSTTFTPGRISSASTSNANGVTYVAYLFAHNAGGFGLTGTDNVISCGSFTTDGSGNATVNLGYEPQWMMVKRADSTSSWFMMDNMRGMSVNGTGSLLLANASDAETNNPRVYPTATGFTTVPGILAASATYIYIAIRRGPMKVPTDGTKVFKPDYWYNTDNRVVGYLGYPADLWLSGYRIGGVSSFPIDRDRLRGGEYLTTSSTAAGTATTGSFWDNQLGYLQQPTAQSLDTTFVSWTFRRAPGFFDEVCYTGTGSATTQTHNLGVAPELLILKSRSGTNTAWWVYASSQTNLALLQTNFGFNYDPTSRITSVNSSSFTVGGSADFGSAGNTYVAYLFATCAGVSKVGSYTGTGATQTISCGFTGGARFVLIKRADTDGYGWYVWDTARGMVSGTDPSLLLNSTAAEVNANSIYTTTGGFQIVSTAAGINASGGSYIYLAIA